jgi:hypothetical protein
MIPLLIVGMMDCVQTLQHGRFDEGYYSWFMCSELVQRVWIVVDHVFDVGSQVEAFL